MKPLIPCVLAILVGIAPVATAATQKDFDESLAILLQQPVESTPIEFLNVWITNYPRIAQECVESEKRFGLVVYTDSICEEFLSDDSPMKRADRHMMRSYDYIRSNPKTLIEWLYLGDTQQMINYKIIRETMNIRMEGVIMKLCADPAYANAEFC